MLSGGKWWWWWWWWWMNQQWNDIYEMNRHIWFRIISSLVQIALWLRAQVRFSCASSTTRLIRFPQDLRGLGVRQAGTLETSRYDAVNRSNKKPLRVCLLIARIEKAYKDKSFAEQTQNNICSNSENTTGFQYFELSTVVISLLLKPP